jgi:exodeoxyribonuclease V gamma subunit
MILKQPLSDPFSSEQILVQSPGMAQWLKLELAQRIGIAANIDFPLPASFLWRTFSQLLEDVPERSAYSKDSMTWVLMSVLPKHLQCSEFSTLESYLSEDQDPLKLYHLCEKIADLFDQYLVYRPDWIANWEAGENHPATAEQLWQPILWRVIVDNTQQRKLPHWHRANMFDAFIKAIGKAEHQDIPQRLFVFGISALPENYLQALMTLGKKCDIHLMVTNPCRQFWGDIVDKRYLGKLLRQQIDNETQQEIDKLSLFEQGNPLLASMGKLGRDYLAMLSELELSEVELFNSDDHSSLLSSIQSDILSLRNRRASDESQALVSKLNQRLAVQANDRSLCLHSCHSPMREVEVLHDQLLDMLEIDPRLEPKDIIIMMPDVGAYSPFVEAVFGQAQANKYLPFSISDRSAQQESPLISNFIEILALSTSRYGCSQILEIMSLPSIMRKLDLDEGQLDLSRHWILESGIKWGLDASNRKELGLPNFSQNSWQFGLDRMFAGFALGDIEQTWKSIAPYSEIEGLDAYHLGNICYFVDLLQRCKKQFVESCAIADWVSFFHTLIKDLYLPNDEDLAALEIIYNALESLQTTIEEADYDQHICAQIVIDYLQRNLTEQRSGQRFLSGKINFCTLMPMRAIPFKVVCLLGMNDGAYPRAVPAMGFDLMAKHARKGDRSRRDDDRYLFLEAMLSAKSKLYISYVGSSTIDNSARAPSVLVSELFEYVQQGYYLASIDKQDNGETTQTINFIDVQSQGEAILAHLSTQHALTAYHQSYFDSAQGLFSYAEQWLSIASLDRQEAVNNQHFIQPIPSADITTLSLEDLVSFFKQPIRYFFQNRLQVNYSVEESVIEDEEPFVLDGLTNYILRDQLLNYRLEQADNEAFREYLNASGVIPIGVAGDKNLSKNIHDVNELAEKIQPLLEGVMRRLSFDLAFDRLQLQGWIEPLYDIGIVKYSAANSSGRIYISTWIEHLAACANGCQHTTFFRAINEQFHFIAVPKTQAHDFLENLLKLFIRGLVSPLPWLADIGWKIFNAQDCEKEMQLVESNYNTFNDPYIYRAFEKWSDMSQGLMALNDDIFMPLSEYLVIDTQDTQE